MKTSFRIALAYALLALIWFLLADPALQQLTIDANWGLSPERVSLVVFLLVSTALVFALSERVFRRVGRLSDVDLLTGLPNRRWLEQAVQQRLAATSGKEWSLVLMDIDRFRDLNDTLGHAVGDEFLRQLAHHLPEWVPQQWQIARIGGDEFALLTAENQNPALLKQQLQHLRQRLLQFSRDMQWVGDLTASIGFASFPQHGSTHGELMKCADMALFHAKNSGRDQSQGFDPQLMARTLERLSLAKKLKTACEQRNFDVHYQLQWDQAQLRWMGVEVLVRWRLPDGTSVAPDRFIPLAEDIGMIPRVTEIVIDKALGELKQHHLLGTALTRVSFNLSPRQFRHASGVESLLATLDRHAWAVPFVHFEVTETAMMENLERMVVALEALSARGVRVSIDDFGTGYSSLSMLKRLPIHELKTDRSFISDLPRDPSDAQMVKTIIAMAKTMHLDVLAEGVETAEQAAFLTEHGCQLSQGFFYARPQGIHGLLDAVYKAPLGFPVQGTA